MTDRQTKRRAVADSDNTLLGRARQFLDHGDYASGISALRGRLAQPLPVEDKARGLLLGNLGASLIDLGREGCDEMAVREAINVYEQYRALIIKTHGPLQYHYNLGNAHAALLDAERRHTGKWNLELARLSTVAKNHYWKSVRSSGSPPPELIINLANNLSTSGRISEALFWFDRALRIDPSHPMANGNRSDCLLWLNTISHSYTIMMLVQAARGYQAAISSPHLRSGVRTSWNQKLSRTLASLARHGKTLEELETDHVTTEEEARRHTPYRVFCIQEHLMLAEHALYCPCAGARRDSLTIPLTQTGTDAIYVPAMELLLNRMKAEFNMARLLYYQSEDSPNPSWNKESFEGTYTNLLDEAAVDVKSEMLRTGFRLCFGIFDRIAFGICSLFNLARPTELIYFHRFWRGKGKERVERWEKLNELAGKFPSLIALYSQATDFNSDEGEWSHLRAYRNALEHELLILGPGGEESLGPFADSSFYRRLTAVPLDKFRAETLHLLRFTASGIFNFTLLARQKAYAENQNRGVQHALDKKPIGPP